MNDNRHWVFVRGDIPEEYWDKSRTPTPTQFKIILELINDKYFENNSMHPSVATDFEFAMEVIDRLGDTRIISTDEFIDSLIHFPDMKDVK